MATLARQIATVSRLQGKFKLRSGVESDTYFDKYRFEADPVLLLAIAKAMAPMIPPDVNALAGNGRDTDCHIVESSNRTTRGFYQKETEIVRHLPVR